VQYYAPWFRWITKDPDIHLKVFYLWRPGTSGTPDPEFLQHIQWDIPLLDGYDYEWVPNLSSRPGTDHFGGLNNPDISLLISQWKPDHILCLGYLYKTFFRLFLDRALANTPFIIRGDSHRLHRCDTLSQHLKDSLVKLIFKRFSSALFCGVANKTYFRKLGIPIKSLYFCPHGIDTDRFSPEPSHNITISLRNQWNIPPGNRVILFAGKFIDKKRPLDLLTAFRKCAPENTTLVFVGDGPLKSQLTVEKTPDVVIQPFINQSQMPDVYRTADLLVLPSYGTSETWGLAVQEALACGTPAIVSDHCGCHLDLITPDQNGLVFAAGNIEALKDCLQTALVPGTLARWNRNTHLGQEKYNYQVALQGLRAAIGL
jgi:glycosyltransferase involved in cell wall biosynthesis